MFEEEQKELDKLAPLTLRKNGKKFVLTDENPAQFIRNFIMIYNKDHKTYRNNAIQCAENRNRSFEDIYCLTKNYFPQVSLENVFHFIIDELFKNTEENWFMGFYCSDIKKTVFRSKGQSYGFNYNYLAESEYYDNFFYRDKDNPFTIEILKRENENLNN